MDRPLAQIIFHVTFESDDRDVIAPVFFQVRLDFVVDGADEPKLGILQVEPMPGLEQVVNALPFDQRAGENRTENRWPNAGLEPLHVHAAGQVVELILGESLDAKGVGRFLRKDEEHVGQIIFLDESFPRLEQVFFPASRGIRPRTRRRFRRPCRDHDAGVGISTIDGIPSLRATRSDCRQSPDQLWNRS